MGNKIEDEKELGGKHTRRKKRKRRKKSQGLNLVTYVVEMSLCRGDLVVYLGYLPGVLSYLR